MLTRRAALRGGTAAVAAIAGAGAVAASVASADDAYLESLYRTWKEADVAYCDACRAEDETMPWFSGIEVTGPDGTVHTCRFDADVAKIFDMHHVSLWEMTQADALAYCAAFGMQDQADRKRIQDPILRRYGSDELVERREAEIARLEKSRAEHEASVDRTAQAEAQTALDAAKDRETGILSQIAETPSVSLRGVLVKLRVWEDNEGDEREEAKAIRESAFADLRRLAGEAQS